MLLPAALDDVPHDLEHDDFSLRDALAGAPDEAGRQVILAAQPRSKVQGLATVHREEQVHDETRPDIHLAVGPDPRGAVEVTVADSWARSQLTEALRDQLVGRYLRRKGCRAGVLPLTHLGRKWHWVLPGGNRTSFADPCGRLDAEAGVIQRSGPGIRVVAGAGALRVAGGASQRGPGPVRRAPRRIQSSSCRTGFVFRRCVSLGRALVELKASGGHRRQVRLVPAMECRLQKVRRTATSEASLAITAGSVPMRVTTTSASPCQLRIGAAAATRPG